MIGPQVARVIDRYGQTRVVPLLVTAHGLAIAGLLAGGPMLPLAVLAGATIPQIGALVAARWSHALAGSELLPTAFALESMASSVAFLAGPALVGTVATLPIRAPGTALAAALVLVGGLALSAQRATAPPPRVMDDCCQRGSGRAITSVGSPRVGFAGVVAANAGLGMVFGALQVAVTAFATDPGAAGLAGPLYSVMNLACLVSAALYGRRPRTLRLPTALALLALASLPPAARHRAVAARPRAGRARPGDRADPHALERRHAAAGGQGRADAGVHVAELGERGRVGRCRGRRRSAR